MMVPSEPWLLFALCMWAFVWAAGIELCQWFRYKLLFFYNLGPGHRI